MKKIPEFKMYIPKEWEKKRLAKWIKIWNFDKELEATFEKNKDNEEDLPELTEFEQASLNKRFKEHVRKFNSEIQVGDIRLLAPNLVKEGSIPRYVAVVKRWNECDYLVAPYSTIAVPAVQGELETDHGHFSLANLELWNSAIITSHLLKKSWFADKMSEKERNEAFSVFKFISAGEELPSALTEKIGAPIFKEYDPRVEYQDNEEEIFKPFRLKNDEYVEKISKIRESLSLISSAEINLSLAADDGEKRSDLFIFKDRKEITFSHENAETTLVAKNIVFDIDSEKTDLRWTFETKEILDCGEIVLALDYKTGTVIEETTLVKEDDEPYLITIKKDSDNDIRKDMKPEDIILIIIKE